MSRWRPPQPVASPYITPAGYAALEAEVGDLWQRRREVVRHLSAAAAEGDRSENAEYIYRKKQLRELDRRIGYLQRRMPVLNIVRDRPPATDRVFFGARVRLEDEAGEENVFRIVGADELDLAEGNISIDAPLARALLGKGLDEEVSVHTAAGVRGYCIVDIDYPDVG